MMQQSQHGFPKKSRTSASISYPQALPHQNLQVGAPQSNMHLNPQSGQLQGQHPIPMQNQFPQQNSKSYLQQ